MSRITWDALGERLYEVGLDHGVLYFPYGDGYTNGIPWNGLTSVAEDQQGHEATAMYSGDIRAENVYTEDEFGGTIKAYTYPVEFERFFGESEVIPGMYITHQERDWFGFSYRSYKGNDVDGTSLGYKIHIFYNVEIVDFSRSYSTVAESLDLEPLEWKYQCFPIEYMDYKPIAELIFDSTKYDPAIMARLENILYGTAETIARLPTLDEAFALFQGTVYPSNDIYPSGLEYHGGLWMVPKVITRNGAYSPEDDEVSGYSSLKVQVRPEFFIVEELPPMGETDTFYYVFDDESEEEDHYIEYMYIKDEWVETGEKTISDSSFINVVRYELTDAEVEAIINS